MPRIPTAVVAAAALLALGAGGCQSPRPFDARRLARASTLATGPVEVVAGFTDGVVLVPVRINGRGPFTFALDTGSSTVVVSQLVADVTDLRVEERRGRIVTEAGRSDGNVSQALVRDLRVGDARFQMTSVLVADLTDLSRGIGRPLDGILGMPVLSHHLWTIDPRAGRVRIEEGSLPADAGDVLTLEMDDGLPAIWIDVADRRTLAIIDTGQRMPLALGPADAADLRAKLRVVGTSLGHVLDGQVRRDVARLDGDVRFGPIALRAPAVVMGRVTRIGMQAFQGRALTFDATGARLRLGPPE